MVKSDTKIIISLCLPRLIHSKSLTQSICTTGSQPGCRDTFGCPEKFYGCCLFCKYIVAWGATKMFFNHARVPRTKKGWETLLCTNKLKLNGHPTLLQRRTPRQDEKTIVFWLQSTQSGTKVEKQKIFFKTFFLFEIKLKGSFNHLVCRLIKVYEIV